MVKKVHLVLQGKGGVGKSYIASLLAQYYHDRALPVVCLDTDPVNSTFADYRGLGARTVTLMEGSVLVERGFDGMVESLIEEDTHFVVDNGSASFVPLTNYLLENNVVELIANSSKEVIVHTVITGNQAMLDTLRGLEQLCLKLPPPAQLVVWLNEFFGPIRANGKGFEDMNVYGKYRARIASIVRIPQQTSSTFGTDVAQMLEKKMTFAEVLLSPDFGLMAKQRLTMVKRTIFEQLAIVV